MRVKKSNILFIGLVIGFVAGIYFGNVSIAISKELPEVEIKEYRGEKLSSVKEFRENSIKGPQRIDLKKYFLTVNGLVGKPAKYTYEQLLKLPVVKKVVTLNCVEGWSVKILWEGFLVNDLLAGAEVSPRAKVAIFHAADGYTTSLPLEFLRNQKIMMAYKMNGTRLTAERGFPFQLVAEEKWGYKWIKWITRVELSDNEKYKGYWESHGYSNGGDLDKDFL
jgi:DMSO/TMAO reductase YedYZ molybdopterin-dependent catalytic subunit